MNPNLFVLGAPKCGTTSIFHWLSQQSEIFVPWIKEPNYYYNPYGQRLSEVEYKALYEDAKPHHKYALDASVYYLMSNTAITEILEQNPNAFFIVCLRNPVEMAPSLHYQKVFTGHETVKEFSDAWSLSDVRNSGSFSGISGLPSCADPKHMSYKHMCLLGEQVAALRDQVSDDKIFFVLMDDLRAKPDIVFQSVCAYLDLAPNPQVSLVVHNRAKKRRSRQLGIILDSLAEVRKYMRIKEATGLLSGFYQLNRREIKYPPVSMKIKSEMRDAFEHDIKLLEHELGRDLSCWLDFDK